MVRYLESNKKLRHKKRADKAPITLLWQLSDFDEDFEEMAALPAEEPKKVTLKERFAQVQEFFKQVFFKKKDSSDGDSDSQ